MSDYLRGQFAKKANVNVETLRYYEDLGLIDPPLRSESGYRLYSDEMLIRIAFIHNAKSCGFTLKEIKKALTKSRHQNIEIDDFIALINKKMAKIQSEIDNKEKTLTLLDQLKTQLESSDKHPEVQTTLQILNMDH
ncbi:Mercuric resistance operon regulatory protein [compost metagenome]